MEDAFNFSFSGTPFRRKHPRTDRAIKRRLVAAFCPLPLRQALLDLPFALRFDTGLWRLVSHAIPCQGRAPVK
jgi:hypothetical protein